MVAAIRTEQITIKTDLYKRKEYLPLAYFSTQDQPEMLDPCPKKFWLSVAA
jgi:hypothetical protein